MEALLVVLSLGLIPIYAFGSGGLQISHVLLVLLMGIRLLRTKWKMTAMETAMLALFCLIALREGYAVFVDSARARGLLDVLYTAFALLMVFTFSRLPLERRIFKRAILAGLVVSAAVAWFGIWQYGASFIVDQGAVERSVGTFNNPNQLAYFALCSFLLASLLYLREEIRTPLYLLVIASSFALGMAALSKAGLIALLFGGLIGLSATLDRKRVSGKLIAACLLLTAGGVQLYSMGALDEFHFVQRLDSIGTGGDDNLNERGYRSPFEHGAVGLLVGLGEERVTRIIGHEVHSTFWSYLLKYGVVGLGLFMTVWFLWIRRTFAEFGLIGVLLINVPVSLYGITHNGSRFAILWLLIGLSFNLYRSGAAAPRPLKSRDPRGYAPQFTGMRAVDWQANPRV